VVFAFGSLGGVPFIITHGMPRTSMDKKRGGGNHYWRTSLDKRDSKE
jgi:hypothetical protein